MVIYYMYKCENNLITFAEEKVIQVANFGDNFSTQKLQYFNLDFDISSISFLFSLVCVYFVMK